MASDYLAVATLPANPRPEDLLAFFNVPPDPQSALDENIARKRRHWHSLAASSPAGREKARAVKALIQEAAEAIKRGTAMPIRHQPARSAPAPQPAPRRRTIEEIWAELEELLFANRVQEAINLATQVRHSWPADPKAHQAYAWCVAGIAQGREVDPRVIADALASIDLVMAANDADPALWDTLVRLWLGTDHTTEALTTLAEAEKRLGSLDQRLMTSRSVARLRSGKTVEGLADAAAAVKAGGADTAVRSTITSTVVREAVIPLLPLRSGKDVDAYARAVEVAAWCAQGAPEAEDLVRPHRLWASRAAQRVYTGSWTTRSMVAVLSLFTALPFYNRLRSRPCYQVLLEGPSTMNPLWRYVAEPDFVRTAHDQANERLPWASYGGHWPTA